MRNPNVYVRRELPLSKKAILAFGLLSMAISACVGQPSISPTLATEPTLSPPPATATSTPFPFSTRWAVCGTIKPGEGVYRALTRAGGAPMHETWKAYIQDQVIIKDSKGNKRVFTVEEVLEENPTVQPGDTVCQTNFPMTNAEMEAAAEGK